MRNERAARELAVRIRQLRQRAGLSQAALAGEVFGLAWHVPVMRMEGGQRKVSAVELWRIAQVLGCELEDFFPDG